MKIKTDQPLMDSREQITNQIANFWDQISEGWRLVWGVHIHHGYYEPNQNLTPKEAQEKLIEKLADCLQISAETTLLDVGCGMGGSSLYLAEKYHAHTTGITLSHKQAAIATEQAQALNINNVVFSVEDALLLPSIKDNSFDIVWSLESCEQMFDKALFIQQAFRVLKPGGKLILATWCSNKEEYKDSEAKKYKKLCLAFDLPYMPTIDWYCKLLKRNNFAVISTQDWSPFVKKSWDIGISLINAYSFFQILRLAGWRGWQFTRQIKMMQQAFEQERVRYGVFLASKL